MVAQHRALIHPARTATQPIVDMSAGTAYGCGAQVRGIEGEGAAEFPSRVDDHNRYRFDQSCRLCAIETARRLGSTSRLSIRFRPNAVPRVPAATLDETSLVPPQR
jgi:hypothetical protein